MENILINPCPYCRSRTCCYVLSGDLETQDTNIENLRQENARLQALVKRAVEFIEKYSYHAPDCGYMQPYPNNGLCDCDYDEAIAELRKG